jgi:hypothetical protein
MILKSWGKHNGCGSMRVRRRGRGFRLVTIVRHEELHTVATINWFRGNRNVRWDIPCRILFLRWQR